jgi:hypothetical protein
MGAIGAGLARQGRGSPGWVRTMRPLRRLGLKACIRIAIFACHGLLARALGDAVAMVDSHSVQVALILRESIQACPNDAKGATKAPQRSLIRCPVYTRSGTVLAPATLSFPVLAHQDVQFTRSEPTVLDPLEITRLR